MSKLCCDIDKVSSEKESCGRTLKKANLSLKVGHEEG